MIVVALGGNALLKRGEPMTAENQRAQHPHRRRGAGAGRHGAPAGHHATATARRSACWRCRARPTSQVEAYPLDVLGAETEGMIGYMIEQELGNLLPFERAVRDAPDDGRGRSATTRRSRTRPSSSARSTTRPTPTRSRPRRAGSFKPDGDKWRRVVPSPLPKRIFEIRPIRWLLEHGTVVICAGGGGIPTMYEPGSGPHSSSASRPSSTRTSLRAAGPRARRRPLRHGDRRRRRVTSTGASPTQQAIRRATPDAPSASYKFPAGSMGPKVEAACRFAEAPATEPPSARWPTFRHRARREGTIISKALRP